MDLDYRGEFGTELVSFVPFVFFLKLYGLIPTGVKVRTYFGMRPYYFFLDDNEIEFYNVEENRIYIEPVHRSFLPLHLRSEDDLFANYKQKASLLKLFVPPPYHHNFNKFALSFLHENKRTVIVQNKFNNEWWEGPLNFMDVDEVRTLCTRFEPSKWNVVYIRSSDFNGEGYSRDNNENSKSNLTLDEKQMLRTEFPNVHIFEELIAQNGVDFNTLKNLLFGNSHLTVSTHGGQVYYDMYFCSRHVVYTKSIPAYTFNYDRQFYQNMHDLLCPVPQEVMFASDIKELITCVDSVL